MTHNRFEELQRRCKALQRKHFLKVCGLILVSFIALFWVYSTLEPLKPIAIVAPESSLVEVIVETNETHVVPLPFEAEVIPEVDDFKEPILFLEPKFKPTTTPTLPQKEIQEANRLLKVEHTFLEAFNHSATYENAYALAHFYFERKSYLEAIVWAKKANKLNPNLDQTWLIYAKSKFSLGEKEEAISSLERIVGYIKSEELHDLLDFYKGQR
ncbi:MAG: hypothetical protein EOL93_04195 [Epsilonproteobacteria bacterium]|nr:hypothetical protein [Campylobacterota bacterium]